MNYLGDFVEDSTVYLMFNTFTSNDPSASCTITNFLNTDIHIHKDDGLAQRNNAAGITVSIDFDGITGSHMIKIDTSDNTVAGFWVTGHDYFVRIEGTTIDAGIVNAVVGHFSVENRHNEVDVVKWLGQACHAVSENGVPKVDLDQIGGVAQSLTDFKDMVDTGYDPATHKLQSDLIYIHGSALTEGAGGRLAAALIKLLDVAVPVLTAESVNQSANNNTLLSDWADGGRLDLILDIIAADTTTDIPAKLLKYIQLLTRSDAAIETDNATELTAINADGGSGVGNFSAQTDSEEASRDRGDAAWVTGGGGSDKFLMADTTIATLASQISFTLTAGSTDDNAYNNCTIVVEDASTAVQKAVGIIANYAGGTKTVTLKYDPAIFVMAPTDKVYILAENALKSTLANRQLNVAADGDIAGNVVKIEGNDATDELDAAVMGKASVS